MEFGYASVLYAGMTIVLLAVVLGGRRKRIWPAGPVGLPLVGHLFHFGADTLDKLEAFHDKYGKSFYLKMGYTDVIM